LRSRRRRKRRKKGWLRRRKARRRGRLRRRRRRRRRRRKRRRRRRKKGRRGRKKRPGRRRGGGPKDEHGDWFGRWRNFRCICVDGYTGIYCEQAPHYGNCASHPCHEGQSCTEIVGGSGYVCKSTSKVINVVVTTAIRRQFDGRSTAYRR